MKTTKSEFRRMMKAILRISLLVLVILQVSVLSARANKDVFVRWGIDSNWNGDGGSVTATGKTVQNKNDVSSNYGDYATVTFTITPSSGYVIDKVEWKHNDSNGFTYGDGTELIPDASKQVSFTLNDKNSSFQVRFALASAASKSFIAYYGTGAIDDTAATAPNWIGGTVTRKSGSNYYPLGTAAYSVNTYSQSGTKTIHITPGTSPNDTIAAVKYCEATWSDPRSVTVVGTPTPIPADSNGEYQFTATDPKSYIIFVQFALIGAVGGHIGAWYGTNNTTGYDTPNANGSGGSVW
ncbi:MAG: hypothetical protein WCL71_00705, partial [Deltaproteobacteria bacterium]